MKPRFHEILEHAIESGIARGWHIAHKHSDCPPEDTVKETIYQCVMGSLSEWFDMETYDNRP